MVRKLHVARLLGILLLKMATLPEPSRSSSDRLRLGIVGCGAITENSHLPAALASPLVEVTVLIDSNAARLNYIKRCFGLNVRCCTNHMDSLDLVDAVVLALPNHLHAPIGCAFLLRGIHVLCEKPLAISVIECEQLCAAAHATDATLAVGYVTRFYPSTDLTLHLIRSRFLGALASIDYEFGTAGGWSPFSGYNISRETSGGGVLTISGSHFLDRMLHLFAEPRLIEYADDSRGGVEANCMGRFEFTLGNNTFPGTVTLSKTYQLGNRLRIIGEKGTLIIKEGQTDSVTFFPALSKLRYEIFDASFVASAPASRNYFQVQLENFVVAIRTGEGLKVDGVAGMSSVRLIQQCYRQAIPIEEPWVDSTLPRLVGAMAGVNKDPRP